MTKNAEESFPQVALFNGEPEIHVIHMKAGYYKWRTSKHGWLKHSLLSIVDEFMTRHGHVYSVHEQTIFEEDEDFLFI